MYGGLDEKTVIDKDGNKFITFSQNGKVVSVEKNGKQVYSDVYGIVEGTIPNISPAVQQATANQAQAAASAASAQATQSSATASAASTTTGRMASTAGALEKGSTKRALYEDLVASPSSSAEPPQNTEKSYGKYEILALRNLAKVSKGLSDDINQASSSIVSGISGLSVGIEAELDSWKAEINQALKPISTSIGSTAMMVENIAKNPLGAPQLLAQGATALLEKISPSLASELEGACKSINVEGLMNLPGQVLGGVRSLTLAADALLSVPFTIVSDIYNGLMDIMEEVANLIDSAVSAIFDFFFGPGGLLDSILPISEILSMLEAIGELASFCGSIAGLAGGFNIVTNITGQITGAVSSISSALKNPLQFVPGIDQVTGGIGQITSALRNPEQFLPPEIGQQIQKISSLPGLGFVSTCGTSIGGTLEGLSQGIFTKALDSYTKQIPMLAPLMRQQSPEPAAVDTQESHSDDWNQSDVRPEQQVTNGGIPAFAEAQTAQWKMLDQNTSYDWGGGTFSKDGVTTVLDERTGATVTSNPASFTSINNATLNLPQAIIN